MVVEKTPEPGIIRTGPGLGEPVGGQGLGDSVGLVLSRKTLKVGLWAGNRHHDVPLGAAAVLDHCALGQDLMHGADQGFVSGRGDRGEDPRLQISDKALAKTEFKS